MPLPFVGIVRVSHMGERKSGADDFHSERDQIAVIEQEAKRRNVPVKILPSELGVSGGLPLEKRPSLLEAVRGVQEGRYAGVIAAYLSRFGRDLEGGLKAWRLIEEAGGQVIIVAENIDTSSVNGRFMRNTYLNIANMEREQHVERFDNLRRWAVENGIWQRRQVPTGYKRDPQTRRLVPSEAAETVREAFREAGAGTTIVAISRRLRMTPSGVRQLLKNRVYLGELQVGEYLNPNAHPPLVDADTFALAQRDRPRPARKGKSPALLAGLVRCSGCGHVMPRGGNSKYQSYSCSRNHSGESCPEPAAISVTVLDEYVEAIALKELAKLSAMASVPEDNVDAAKEALSKAQNELQAFVTSVSAADIGAEAFSLGARQRREAVDIAQAELQRALEASAVPGVLSGDEVWNELDAAQRNALLRTLLSGVIVRATGRGKRVSVTDKARIIKFGADIPYPVGRGGKAAGILSLPFPDSDSPDVLGSD
jgi:site-specific DNA recombinase